MKNLSKFQLVVLGVFVVLILGGVLVFSLARTTGRGSPTKLTVWGTMPASQFTAVLRQINLDKNDSLKVNYEQKPASNFDLALLEALAAGQGPDLFFISSESILKHRGRILPLSFKTFSERTFKNSFLEGTEIFLETDSVLAFPVLVDPLVMYWNRDIFTDRGLVRPPVFWDELYDLAPALTRRDGALNILKSAAGLGEFLNIAHAEDILSALILQIGNPITGRQGQKLVSVLNDGLGLPVLPAERALSFYTDFSNPLKPFYSWNRSLPWSFNHFLAGDLAVYFGPASEFAEIQAKNPNLNFDATFLPQAQAVSRRLTYGRFEGLALSRNSRQPAAAFQLALLLSGQEAGRAWSQATGLPPARRDLLAERPARAFQEIFYGSALVAKGWLMPEKETVRKIFRDMVESVTGGRSRPKEAVQRAHAELNLLLE